MNDIQIYSNPDFGEVRTISKDGEPLFVAKDICGLFGDKNSSRSVSRVDEEDKCPVELTDALGRAQTAIAVNESGLYALLFAMQPQKANHDGVSDAYPIEIQERIDKLKAFKRWITHEVIPTIRKTGGYVNNDQQFINTYLPFADENTKMLFSQTLSTIRRQNAKIEADKPKVIFSDAVSASKTSILVGDLAKLIRQNGVEIGQKRLFAWLRENGYLIRRSGADYNMPTQRSMEMGLFEIKETAIAHSDGHTTISKTPKITGKGQTYFVNKFNSIVQARYKVYRAFSIPKIGRNAEKLSSRGGKKPR